jgi:hypothetical protein
MSDLIVNIALKRLYIYEKGTSNKLKGETKMQLKQGDAQVRQWFRYGTGSRLQILYVNLNSCISCDVRL